MKIYNYNPIDLSFTNESEADQDPLNKDLWLIPAFATTVKIGNDKPFHKQVFNVRTQMWSYVLDETTRPSNADEWDEKKGKWVLNAAKQAEIELSTLKVAKNRALSAAVEYADNLQATILGDASPAAQARLAGKYDAAVAIKSGTASAGDHAVIDAEVNLRPKYTKAQLVDVIIKKGTLAKQAEGMINGMLLLAQDAFESAQTIEELGERVEAITAQADALKSKLLAAMGGAA